MAHGSSDKLSSLSSPLSSMSACCAELSGDTPFIVFQGLFSVLGVARLGRENPPFHSKKFIALSCEVR